MRWTFRSLPPSPAAGLKRARSLPGPLAIETGFFLLLTFIQLAGVPLLLARRDRFFTTLGVLLAFNGVLTALRVLQVNGLWNAQLASLNAALDDPTGWMLFAAIGFRRGWNSLTIPSIILAAGTAASGAAGLQPGGTWAYYLLVRYPLYAGMATLILLSARGTKTDRWVALAFIPRALMWPTMSYGGGLEALWRVLRSDPLGERINLVVVTALAIACLVALAHLRSRPGDGPARGVVLAIAAIGPINALAFQLIPGGSSPEILLATEVANYPTLAIIRPLLLYVALDPARVSPIFGRSSLAAGLGTLTAWAAPGLALPQAAGAILALIVGLTVLILLESLSPGVSQAPAPTTTRPHWQTLIVTLHRAGAGRPQPPAPLWTQQGLSQSTGISIQRVSEFPKQLNATAVSKLDAHWPEWRQGSNGGPQQLVDVQTGAVPGLVGPRVYYRLTPLGAGLAERIDEMASRNDPAREPWVRKGD